MSEFHSRSLASGFIRVLRSIVDGGIVNILEPSVIDHAELCGLQTPAHQLEPWYTCTHWEIQKQIKARPLATAVNSWDFSVTYAQLGHYATRLALHLQRNEVGPESKVPICFPKTAWAAIAMVAVQMAGAAFVPLDPNAPLQRLQSIVEDCHATMAIVHPNYVHILESLGLNYTVTGESFKSDEPWTTLLHPL